MYTPFKLDKVRNFRYGMRALHQIEKMLNVRIAKLDFDDLSQYQIAVIVWAGLVHEDIALNPDIVMDLIDEHSSITEIAQVMAQAFQDAFATGEEGKHTAPKTAIANQ